MAAAFQQQIFALDARFNTYRAPNNPSFKTLYIRRRSQLLRENAKFKDIDTIRQYINVRSQLLQRRYGVRDNISISSSASWQKSNSKVSLSREDSPCYNKKKNELSISENYAFSGVHHIFDQHSEAVSVVKFANNDRARLCCASHDGAVSVCDVAAAPPAVSCVLRGHTQAVTGVDWSASNDLLVSCSADGSLALWDMGRRARLRRVTDRLRAPVLCCAFLPANNNMVIAGNARGMVELLNVSTGIYPRGGSSVLGGQVTALACESSGRVFWAANDKGSVVSYRVQGAAGLAKLRRLALGARVSALAWSPWLARQPALLVNAADNSLYLFRVSDGDGSLALRRRFDVAHASALPVRGSFCPVMSLRRGACVVSGSEDCAVHFIDAEGERGVVNKLQGHAHPVLGVSFSYDESLLATSDASGLVIVWRRS